MVRLGVPEVKNIAQLSLKPLGTWDLPVRRVLFIALVLAVQFSAGISYISAMEEGVKILFPTVSHNLGLMAITVVLMGTTLLAPNLRDIAFLQGLPKVVDLTQLLRQPPDQKYKLLEEVEDVRYSQNTWDINRSTCARVCQSENQSENHPHNLVWFKA